MIKWVRRCHVSTLDAGLHTFTEWLADDGSQGGSLWLWAGKADNGERFELIGIDTDWYDDDGLITYELVEWPYANDYVKDAVKYGN